MNEEGVIHFKTIEYLYWEKGSDWFWALGIITLSGALLAAIFGNFLLAILILLAAFTLAMYAVRKPKTVDVKINRKGVTVGKLFYPYSSLESFWIEHYGEFSKLLLKSKKMIMPYIIVIIPEEPEDLNSEMVMDLLDEYLPQEEHSESVFEKVMERLGF